MCIIVDNNVAAIVLLPNGTSDYAAIRQALTDSKARLCVGGKLLEELNKNEAVRRLLKLLDQAGVLRPFSDAEINKIEKQVIARGGYKSDDPHVLALAKVSAARVLCSRDKDLVDDFRNPALLSPKGKIFKNHSHARLIDTHCRSWCRK